MCKTNTLLMWLNPKKVSRAAITEYQHSLHNACPNYVVIDGLFNAVKLNEVVRVLQRPDNWDTQKHTYSALYVDNKEWQNTSNDERFVQRDVWRRNATDVTDAIHNTELSPSETTSTQEFLSFLRGDEFLSILSRIFNVALTDANVANPNINTNYFRLGATDFVEQHADDSPGREVCLLLYLNKSWHQDSGGELCFKGDTVTDDKPIMISPLYNRCVLFNPASKGAEHWVQALTQQTNNYRYNVTSWYWTL